MTRKKSKKALKKKNWMGSGILQQMNTTSQRKYTMYTGKKGSDELDRSFAKLFFDSYAADLRHHLLDNIFAWDNFAVEQKTFELINELKECTLRIQT